MTMNEYLPNKHIQQPNFTNTPNGLVIGKGVLSR